MKKSLFAYLAAITVLIFACEESGDIAASEILVKSNASGDSISSDSSVVDVEIIDIDTIIDGTDTIIYVDSLHNHGHQHDFDSLGHQHKGDSLEAHHHDVDSLESHDHDMKGHDHDFDGDLNLDSAFVGHDETHHDMDSTREESHNHEGDDHKDGKRGH